MVGGGTLGFPRSNALAVTKTTTACNLKDQAKRTILRNVRSQGHTYVELREEGKKSIFFCTLCLAPCYSDSVLFDHLKGSLHSERLSTAKVTLLGRNPWPFNDGVVFFTNETENGEESATLNGNQSSSLDRHDNGDNLALVPYSENEEACAVKDHQIARHERQNGDKDSVRTKSDYNLSSSEENSAVLIPSVRVGGEVTDIEVKEVGYGLIAARFRERDSSSDGISRIWCEWLGKKTNENEDLFNVPEHDFAIVTFSYNDFNLGTMGHLDDVKALLYSNQASESQNGDGPSSKKRKKSPSDTGDDSENSNTQYDDSGGENSSAVSNLMLKQFDDQLLDARFISSKAIRRELRRKQRIAAERMCDICQHKMLPGKDVATLMNVKNGKLACSGRNGTGAFHLFHTSCLIHWVLLCEHETISNNQPEAQKVKRRPRRKPASKGDERQKETDMKAVKMLIKGVLCPECQGTGTAINGDEKPSVPLSKMFKYKIKVSDARRAWMKSPEVLENCSTGFHFPSQSVENLQEKAKPLKLLLFYGAH